VEAAQRMVGDTREDVGQPSLRVDVVELGLHVLLGEVRAVEGFGMSLEVPVLATIDPAALVLTLAAVPARAGKSRPVSPTAC
jgi:hypothetical protein